MPGPPAQKASSGLPAPQREQVASRRDLAPSSACAFLPEALRLAGNSNNKKKHFLKVFQGGVFPARSCWFLEDLAALWGWHRCLRGVNWGVLVPLLLWVGASPRVRLPRAVSEPTEPRSLLTTKVLVEITVSGRQMKYSPFFSLAGLHEWKVSVWN